MTLLVASLGVSWCALASIRYVYSRNLSHSLSNVASKRPRASSLHSDLFRCGKAGLLTKCAPSQTAYKDDFHVRLLWLYLIVILPGQVVCQIKQRATLEIFYPSFCFLFSSLQF